MGVFCVCVKLMLNEVVVVKLWMISWLNVVVVVMGCVVDELMHWVFLFIDWWWKLLLMKVWWNLDELLNYDEMMFCFQVLCDFECLIVFIYL